MQFIYLVFICAIIQSLNCFYSKIHLLDCEPCINYFFLALNDSSDQVFFVDNKLGTSFLKDSRIIEAFKQYCC